MAELRFPVRDPEECLVNDLPEVLKQAVAAGQLDEAEVPVIRELRDRLIVDGADTFGDALTRLEALGAAGQRRWLDQARQAVGLPTATEVEKARADAKFERELERISPPPPEPWSEMQSCPYCMAFPIDEHGRWIATDLERWHCPEHRDKAGPDDLQKHEPAYTGLFTRGGRPIPTDKEKARIKAWNEECRQAEEDERRRREEHDRRQAEALTEVRERFDREAEVSVLGIRVHPGNVKVN